MKVQQINTQQTFQAKAKNFITLPKALLTPAEKKARVTCKVSPYCNNMSEKDTNRILQAFNKSIQKGLVQRLAQNPRKVRGYRQTQTFKKGSNVIILATSPTGKKGLPVKIFEFSPKTESGMEIQKLRSDDLAFDEVTNALNAIG